MSASEQLRKQPINLPNQVLLSVGLAIHDCDRNAAVLQILHERILVVV